MRDADQLWPRFAWLSACVLSPAGARAHSGHSCLSADTRVHVLLCSQVQGCSVHVSSIPCAFIASLELFVGSFGY